MGLTGLLSLIIIGGIAAGGYYYRDSIGKAFASEEEKELDLEEKEYDFDRKKENDAKWDNFWDGGKQNQKQASKDAVDYSNYKQGIDNRTQSEINQWYIDNGIKNPNGNNDLQTYNKKGNSVFN